MSAALALATANGATAAPAKATSAKPARIDFCHGFGCLYRSKLILSARDARKLAAIMAAGAASPAAERKAIKRADAYFETRMMQVTGVRDQPKADFGLSRKRGQMDCIDESTNTRALLLYLAGRGLLKYHKVERNASRGFFIDGRYPHFTAVIRDPSGVKWAVDSWYAPMGGSPDIIPMSEWKPRGVLSSGALDQ